MNNLVLVFKDKFKKKEKDGFQFSFLLISQFSLFLSWNKVCEKLLSRYKCYFSFSLITARGWKWVRLFLQRVKKIFYKDRFIPNKFEEKIWTYDRSSLRWEGKCLLNTKSLSSVGPTVKLFWVTSVDFKRYRCFVTNTKFKA